MQLSLLDSTPRARRTDPITSHEAAAKAAKFAGGHAARILEALQQHGPQSAHDLSQRTGLSVVQVDRRLPELKASGRAAPTGAVRDGFRVWGAL
jgi:predicted transcriptional regulator